MPLCSTASLEELGIMQLRFSWKTERKKNLAATETIYFRSVKGQKSWNRRRKSYSRRLVDQMFDWKRSIEAQTFWGSVLPSSSGRMVLSRLLESFAQSRPLCDFFAFRKKKKQISNLLNKLISWVSSEGLSLMSLCICMLVWVCVSVVSFAADGTALCSVLWLTTSSSSTVCGWVCRPTGTLCMF